MKKILIILTISSALVAGFFYGKKSSQQSSLNNLKDKTTKFTPILDELKKNPSKELYEKLFLLLLAEIGIQNLSFEIDIPVQEKIVEVIKQTKCPDLPIQKTKKCPVIPTSKTSNDLLALPSDLKYRKNINSIYKKSYVLTNPIDIIKGSHRHEILKNGYDSDTYTLNMNSKLEHDGKKWMGKFIAEIVSEEKGQIDHIETEGVSTAILLAPTNPASIFIDFKKFVVHMQINKKRIGKSTVYRRDGKFLKPWGRIR
jgi:hypothetical protein